MNAIIIHVSYFQDSLKPLPLVICFPIILKILSIGTTTFTQCTIGNFYNLILLAAYQYVVFAHHGH